VQLIAATTTRTGLNVKSEIDTAIYPPGIKVTDRDLAAINITPHAFHGEWTSYPVVKGKKRLCCLSSVVSTFDDLAWPAAPQGWRVAPPPSAASALTHRAPRQSGF
jgi:hypothetical protein